MQVTFGKHKGQEVSSLPDSYLEWGASNLDSPKWRKAFKDELSSRRSIEKTMRDRLKADFGDEGALKWFSDRLWDEAETEISESGCEWEYPIDYHEKCVDTGLEALKRRLSNELKREEKRAAYLIAYPYLTDKIIDAIVSAYNSGYMERENFSSDERFEVAKKIGKDLGLMGSMRWEMEEF
jgi:hypothetical protein